MSEEPARLTIKKAKSQKKDVYTFALDAGDKPITVSWFKGPLIQPDDWLKLPEDQPIPITVERKNGLVESVTLNGICYTKAVDPRDSSPRHPGGRRRRSRGGTRPQAPANASVPERSRPEQTPSASENLNRGEPAPTAEGELARAPYNFVPLNDVVVPFNSPPRRDCYHADRLSGYLDIRIKTRTPLFIGGKHCDQDVFMAVQEGQPYVPGSSWRGLIRELIEIVSYGHFTMLDANRRLFFRALMDSAKNLETEYQQAMQTQRSGSGKGPKYEPKSLGGYLTYREDTQQYAIAPAKHHDPKGYQFVAKENALEPFSYKKLPETGGYWVVSGNMPNKKRMVEIGPRDPNGKPIVLSNDDVGDYRDDTERNTKRKDGSHTGELDLLQMAKDRRTGKIQSSVVEFPAGVPVFYSQTVDACGQTRVRFGHTPYFRVSYNYTVGKHVPEHLREDGIRDASLDLAEILFGRVGKTATRLFFEDLTLTPSTSQWQVEGDWVPKVLNSPKPTTFQHYLEQPDPIGSGGLNHWNTPEAAIRGYKAYWHRVTPADSSQEESWVEPDPIDLEDTQHITMHQVVQAGTTFTGRIRFENLSPEELGAVLFVLQLPEGCALKLGMGKPLGLGSVEVSVDRIIQWRPAVYYRSLVHQETWELGEEDIKAQSETYRQAFERYMLDAIHAHEAVNERSALHASLWDELRLRQLKKMLTVPKGTGEQNAQWNDRTRYLQIKRRPKENEYKKRNVLPSIDRVFEDHPNYESP